MTRQSLVSWKGFKVIGPIVTFFHSTQNRLESNGKCPVGGRGGGGVTHHMTGYAPASKRGAERVCFLTSASSTFSLHALNRSGFFFLHFPSHFIGVPSSNRGIIPHGALCIPIGIYIQDRPTPPPPHKDVCTSLCVPLR